MAANVIAKITSEPKYQICPSRSVMNITVSLFTELGPSQLATTVRRSALVRTARGERWALAAAQ